MSEVYITPQSRLVLRLGLLPEVDPALADVAAKWPSLPPAMRAGIVTLTTIVGRPQPTGTETIA